MSSAATIVDITGWTEWVVFVPVAFWTFAYTPIATINREKTCEKRREIVRAQLLISMFFFLSQGIRYGHIVPLPGVSHRNTLHSIVSVRDTTSFHVTQL